MVIEKNTQNILCIRLDNIGDIIMTSPALRAIKEKFPNSHLTLLTSSTSSIVAKYIPFIDDVLEANVVWEKKLQADNSRSLMKLIGKIKRKKFDAAIIFTVYSQNPFPTGLLCYLAEIPHRIAYCHENPNQLFTIGVPDLEPSYEIKHEVQRQLDLVGQLGCTTLNTRLSLEIGDKAIKEIYSMLKVYAINDTPLIILHPGATVPWRQYNPDAFIYAGKALMRKGYTLIVTGTHDEKKLTEYITKAIKDNTYNFCGLLTLEQLIALIDSASLLISNNTGPIHIAAARNTPVVDLYALTNPQHTPWGVQHRVLYFPISEKNKKFYHNDSLPLSGNIKLLKSYKDIVNAAMELLPEGQINSAKLR